ncbi:MAG: hypothetical protein ACREPC_03125 [Stenotrophomonas sp.]|uniref:phage tail tube protein n=1 Tax=Stenotrophomonas sp. TaxID=69392 RepID=UPI003D6CE583
MSGSLFSLQGYIRTGEVDAAGKIGKMRWVGNVPEATLELATSNTDKNESFSGKRLQIGRLATGTTAALNLTLDYWSAANLALGFQATVADIAASTVTGEVFPSGLVAGDQVRLDHPFASALVLTDSATTPATVPPANYDLVGHGKNIVEVKNVGSLQQPFKAAYSHEAAENIVLFSAPGKVTFLQFDGINTETEEPVIIDLWRVRFDPVSSLGLINQEYGNLALSAAVLYDTTRAADAALGGFGRMLQKKAAG